MTGDALPIPAGWTAPPGDADAAVLRWLRAARGNARAKAFGYNAYVVLLLLVSWYGLYVFGLFLRIQDGAPYAEHGRAVLDALPTGAVAGVLLGTLFVLRDALWRGPVVLPRTDADWLLPMPVPRWPLLRPWFALSAGVLALAGVLAGFAGALGLAAAGLGDLSRLVPACCGPLLALGVAAGPASAAVQRFPAAARRVRHATVPVLGIAGLLVWASVAAARGGGTTLPGTVAMWSGPWGWAVQPAVAAAGGHAPLWPVALVLLGVTAAVAALFSVRIVRGMPTSILRERARTSGALLSAFVSLDTRAMWLTVARAGRVTRPPGRYLRWLRRTRPPRPLATITAVVFWRDAVGLLAAPRRLCVAVLLSGAAVGLSAAGRDATGRGAYALTAVVALLGQLAAGRLLDPARLDAEDTRRAAWWPRSRASLALRHAVTPTAALIIAALPSAALVCFFSGPRAVVLVLAVAPVFVAAGLTGAYRPSLPSWMTHGAAAGETGPVLGVLWPAAAPAVAIAGTTVLLAPAISAGADPGIPWGAAIRALCFAALLLCWLWAQTRTRSRN